MRFISYTNFHGFDWSSSNHKDVFGMTVDALKTSDMHLFRADHTDIALECTAVRRAYNIT